MHKCKRILICLTYSEALLLYHVFCWVQSTISDAKYLPESNFIFNLRKHFFFKIPLSWTPLNALKRKTLFKLKPEQYRERLAGHTSTCKWTCINTLACVWAKHGTYNSDTQGKWQHCLYVKKKKSSVKFWYIFNEHLDVFDANTE